jgi:hypothetical protein
MLIWLAGSTSGADRVRIAPSATLIFGGLGYGTETARSRKGGNSCGPQSSADVTVLG